MLSPFKLNSCGTLCPLFLTPVKSCPDTPHDNGWINHRYGAEHLSNSDLQEIYASYFGIGQSYSRLREDKINGSLDKWVRNDQIGILGWFDSILFNLGTPKAATCIPYHKRSTSRPIHIGITWIPQDFSRSWSLGRNPSQEIAITIHSLLKQRSNYKIGVVTLFDPTSTFGISKDSIGSQKSASRIDRNSAERFTQKKFTDNQKAKSLDAIVVCDDFMATGTTAKAFAKKISKIRLEIPLFAYALAFRPQGLEHVLQRGQSR